MGHWVRTDTRVHSFSIHRADKVTSGTVKSESNGDDGEGQDADMSYAVLELDTRLAAALRLPMRRFPVSKDTLGEIVGPRGFRLDRLVDEVDLLPAGGEQVCAFVRAASGAQPTEESIKDFCRERVAHFKVPRYVLFADEFPMTVTGKIQKYRLREIACEQLGLQ